MQNDVAITRLPHLEPAELDAAQTALRAEIVGGPRAADDGKSPLTDDRGRLLGPFNAMLFNPVLGDAIQSLGAAIRYRTSLSDATREIAILTLAATLDSAFEVFAHEPLARAAGISDDTLSAITAGRAPQDLSTVDAIVYRCSLALIAHGDLDDARFAQLTQALGTTGAVELVALIGYYRMLALQLRVFRVGVPER